MLLAEVAEVGEFVFAVNAADRIVRTAKDKEFGVWLYCGFHRIEVECPLVVGVEAKRGFNQFTICVVRSAEERRIDRRRRHHGFVCCDVGVAAEIDRWHEAGQEVEPMGFGAVAMLAIQVVEDGFDRGFVRDRVAVDAVVEALLQGGDDFGRGREVHVGDPQGQDVAAFIFVPFKGAVASAIGTGVEIVRCVCHMREHDQLRVVILQTQFAKN